jgi:hypothetical protein
MSNTGYSELDSKGSSGPQPAQQSLTNMLSGPYSLPSLDKPTVSVSNPKKLIRQVIYKKLCEKMEKVGFSYELDLEEQALTSLEASAVPSSRTSTVTTLVRKQHKGQDYLVWYSIERGYDAAGNEVIGSGAYIPHGLDKDVQFREIKNAEGETVKLQLTNKVTDMYTEPFSKQRLEEILNNNELDEKIQFSFTDNFNKSFGGFSAQEIMNCSTKELSSRGTLGKAGTDLSVMYSELTAKDTLFLQSQAPK